VYDLIVVGGGPAGMMAALSAAKHGKQVVLLEKNEKLGKKLYITGKGRCNITNDSDVENHLNHCVSNPKFMYSAYYTFDSQGLIRFFNEMGLPTKVERGDRVFPASNKSSDVIKVMTKALRTYEVSVKLNTAVIDLIIDQGNLVGVMAKEQGIKKEIYARSVLIATGGVSYSMTGSTGDGYQFAKKRGHKIIKPVQGLVPIETVDRDIMELQGLSLRNITLTLWQKGRKKPLFQELGEMLFTHFGVTGPLVLSAGSYIPRNVALDDLWFEIDLKPGLDEEKLDKRLVRDFEKYMRKNLKNGLVDILPSSMISIVIARAGLEADMNVHQVTKEHRSQLLSVMKKFCLGIRDYRSFEEAIITRGGIDVKTVNPHTMESVLVQNLYFAGEVLDVDALTGGYNLQIAFSTGYLAGLAVAEKE